MNGVGESTHPVAPPSTASLVDELIALLQVETEELTDEDLLADLHVRLALVQADVLHDHEASIRHLEVSDRHPLAWRLLVSQAITDGDSSRLDGAQALVEDVGGDERWRAAALREIAEAWLYRFAEPARATELARSALELRADPETTAELQHLYVLSLSVSEEWAELSAALADVATHKRASTQNIAEAVHLLADRLADPEGAADLLAKVFPRLAKLDPKEPAAAQHTYRVLLSATEVCSELGAGPIELAEVLRRRAGIADSEGAPHEAGAVRFVLAESMSDQQAEGASKIFSALAQDSAGWGPRLAWLARARLARGRGDWSSLAASLRALAKRDDGGPLANAYLWRAAEIVDARVDAAPAALELWRAVADCSHAGEQAARAIERLLLASEPGELIAHLEAVAVADSVSRRACLRRASAVAESRAKDLGEAVRLLRRAAENSAVAGDHEHLARMFRRQHDLPRLAEQYRAFADTIGHKRIAAAVLCAAGIIELSRGRGKEAEEAFAAAAQRAPKDVMARAALAMLFRRGQRWRELATTLQELAVQLCNETSRTSVLRELGRLSAGQLGDARRARQALEQALELDPDDGDTMHALAELYDHAREWARSVELRQRAVETSADPVRRANILMEIGQIEETRRNDDAAALAAYERAFELDSGAVGALRAQQALHRKRRRQPELLAVLRAELELDPDPERRLAIQLEIAKLTQDKGGPTADVDAAVEALLDALAVDPESSVALAGIERIGRAQSRWDIVARAFRGAPKTATNLRILADALEKLEAWSEFAEVRLMEISQVPQPADKARLAHGLGEIYENRLGDIDNAVQMYQRALDTGAAQPATQAALARLLEGNQRWPELTASLERELAATDPGDVERQIGLLLRLGELRRDRLSKPGDAALAYEAILERQPHHVPALEALEQLYDKLGREKDLLRVLESRAEATEGSLERSELYTRIAHVREGRGELDEALAAYREAFRANAANREVFTAMEKLCYQQERWSDAMDLYGTAIELVEERDSRAYRLGDLYARRGQVQLQYLHELGEAAASYLRVIELDPDNDTSVKFLESIFSQQDDWAGLLKAYEKRAEMTRDDERRLETLRKAARVAGAKLKDPSEAARIYDLILAVDPGDREALDALERFHERSGDWNKLVEILKMRLSSAPAGDAATALLKRIAQICEEGLRDEERAIEHYLRILEIAPGNREALEALGRIYESTEQWAEFIDVTRRQIRVTTDRNVKALLYFKCGSVMEAKFGKEEDAIRYYDAAIKTSPSCLPAVHGLRDLYRRRTDWPRVIQTLELEVKLWQDDKERAGVFAQIGRIYADQLGQPERAMHYYESALAVDPECLPANKALFEHYFEAGEWDRAAGLAQALAQKAMREGDPTARSEFYRKRGIVAQMTGDARGAAESLIIALEIKPVNLEALTALGQLAKADPEAYDFEATYRELDKIYKKRDDAQPYLARVRVAQAVMKEREGDLDAAEQLYAEANELSSGDFAILLALVDLHANTRRWTHAVEAIVRFLESEPAREVQLEALMRQAEIHADCEMDPHRAIAVLREVLRLEPGFQDAYYRLAQEHYSLGRFDEAREAVDRAIELAAAPGSPVSPEVLARYYYYRGRIIDAGGDQRGSASQFRRAAEYDPGYAPPALALAKRAAETGDQRQAETLLINAAHAAMEAGGAHAAVPLQRGLARILLSSGERDAAIEAYRGILNVEPDGAADRVALAEIYAVDDLPRAVNELKKVVDRDIRHAPAYRLLASFYARSSEHDRAVRVLSVMEMLGFAEEADLGALQKARSNQTHAPLRRMLDDDLRHQLLSTDAVRSPTGEIFAAAAAEITGLFPQPLMGENLVPIQTLEDPAFKVALADTVRLFGIEPEIYVGENVPGGAVLLAHPRKIAVLDRQLLGESDAARRYLLGWAFEGIRGGYALLFSLGSRQRQELGSLLRSLMLPESERAGPTNEFVRSLPRRAAKVIERHSGSRDMDIDSWLDGMLAMAKRAGLFACDDFGAATRMIALLGGEDVGVGHESTVALGAVLGGADLIRFYLSDDYHRLREILSNPLPAAGA